MNPSTVRIASIAVATGALSTVGPLLAAQSQPSSTPTPEVVIQLSPFTVDTSRDVGYRTTNSISATRTNVPIAELPMNIQVVTSQLLDDLAVTSPTPVPFSNAA